MSAASGVLDIVPYPEALVNEYRRTGGLGELTIPEEFRAIADTIPIARPCSRPRNS